MTSLYLIRHGETDWNKTRRIQGRSDIPLNETGRRQALRAAAQLAGHHWDHIVASPLSRARETAQIIAHELGLAEPIVIPELVERNYGQAEGLTRTELDARFPEEAAVPGRESRFEVAGRAIPALIALGEEFTNGSVLAVTHGGLIRSVLMALQPEDGLHHTEPITNGSVHTLRYDNAGLTLVGFDDVSFAGRKKSDIRRQNAVERREATT
ncbi:histidine phosphatase family protein [Salinibacterium hongtaonis]|uniref:Histidine phosphatase family protein n=1 Tax=Homoserinimonas hongtaonis TaxID=2079791 RepID=A0A2U1SYH2_9MICO|nr:histidine phosphatase family protein [Salinibacterium hongtaonis]PWB96656.1 histidine phosphatase family protein [Salinibacterium hongtaonis]